MRKLFFVLLILSIVLILGMGVFVFYYYPRFVRPRLNYQEAVELYKSGEYVSAAMSFESMSGYTNSEEFARRAWKEAGRLSYDAGDYALARTYYKRAGAEKEVLDAIDEKFFLLGSDAYAEGDRLKGESCFQSVSEDSVYLSRMDPIRIAFAEKCLEANDFDTASSVLAVCGPDTYEQIAKLWQDCGEANVHAWDLVSADLCFAKALNYSGSSPQMQAEITELWKQASDLAEADGDLELAEKCAHRAGIVFDPEMHQSIITFREAVHLYENGEFISALQKFEEAADYSGSEDYINEIKRLYSRYFVAGGSVFCASLGFDGAVRTYGDWEDYDTPDWHGIESLAVGFYRFMLGLKADGTVLGSGNGSWGNLEVGDWHDITQVACGDMHSLGLMEDGTVVACGRDYYGQVTIPQTWQNVAQVDAGVAFSAALLTNGDVKACGINENGQCETGSMHDVVQIACGASHLVALRSDGTVSACGLNDRGQCNVSGWSNIVAVYAGAYHTVGVKADGTLVACGSNDYGECRLADYRDPLCVSCGANFTLLVLSDGTEIKLGAINNVIND